MMMMILKKGMVSIEHHIQTKCLDGAKGSYRHTYMKE